MDGMGGVALEGKGVYSVDGWVCRFFCRGEKVRSGI